MTTFVFALAGRPYESIHITNYTLTLETLDGEGTGRSRAPGWPMIRDPQGQIINLSLEFAATESNNADFIHLYNTCRSMGTTDFVQVEFVDPFGGRINQPMYCVSQELSMREFSKTGINFTHTFTVDFIAQKGV